MKKDMTFEEAMSALEIAVSKLEGQDVSLDQSLEIFEDAIGLIKLCNEKLNNAEQKVKMLIESRDGSITDVPFSEKNDET